MATAGNVVKSKWTNTAGKFDFRGVATSVFVGPFGDDELFADTGPFDESWHLKMENARLIAENEGLKAKVAAMQAVSAQPNMDQADIVAIFGEIVAKIQEEFPKFPLVSSAYCAFSEQMKEVSVNVVMDALDYDTEKELVKFFIEQEDKFPNISLQTRFPVLSAEEVEEAYPSKGSFKPCYKRGK